MEYTNKEIELAHKYVTGEYTETQFNYWVSQNNLDKEKMHELIEYLQSVKPVFLIAKMLLIVFILYMLVAIFSIFYFKG